MVIVDLDRTNADHMRQTAELLYTSFRGISEAWPTLELAMGEVLDSLEEKKVSRVALDDEGTVCGWIGGSPQYDGHVMELHPLVVREEMRGIGVGTALVTDLERHARAVRASTIFVGTDDESGATSLSGQDLYEDTFGKLERVRNLANHPFEFYQKVGFRIVGVLPDANGPMKPDIYMAKRVTYDVGREE